MAANALLTRPRPTAPATAAGSGGLALPNLLLTAPQLAELLVGETAGRRWLDAYLLVAAIDQLAEDHLQGGAERFEKCAGYVGPVAGRVARTAGSVVGARRRPAAPSRRWHEVRARLVTDLAFYTVAGPPTEGDAVRCLRAAEEVQCGVAEALGARAATEVLRLPSAFRSFDLDVADMMRLAEELGRRFGDRRRPICVVGVRTSGTYLAPLVAAALARLGYQSVSTTTLRPGHRLDRRRRARLAALAAGGGLVTVVDDPPTTGSCVASVARQLEQMGVPRRSIALLLPLFGAAGDVPASLAPWACASLPWERWSIHERLAPAAAGPVLASLLGVSGLTALEPLAVPQPARVRAHARAGYRAWFTGADGRATSVDVLVKGAGLGFFGRHGLAVAGALGAGSPRVLGVHDGLLYREWLPAGGCLDLAELSGAAARSFAGHVAARARALPVEADPTPAMAGRTPVWEAASNLMSGVYGRAWWLARVVSVDPVIRQVLRPTAPSVIDGNTAGDRWFRGPGGRLLKVDGDERAFSNLDLACFDAAYDVAVAAAHAPAPSVGAGLRAAWERASGNAIAEEAWLLYLLVALWDLGRRDRLARVEVARRSEAAMRAFYESVYFADIEVPAGAGPVCALDVDGVLETRGLGFTALTPASALALRALLRHGYRPVLATGRSPAEVAARCAAYRLAGGVAEYGAVAYHHATGRSVALASAKARRLTDAVRRELAAVPGLHVDERFNHVVRAYRLEGGLPSAPHRDTVVRALGAIGAHVLAVEGDDQTDLVPREFDKGSGLGALVEAMGGPVVLAVGDHANDLPFLRLARHAIAPAHARGLPVRRTGQPYQAGLAQAVAGLLGHRPGGCPACRLPAGRPRSTARFLRLLAAHEGSVGQALWRTAELAVRGRLP